MPHHAGLRAKTRDLFQKGFKKAGAVPLARIMTTYRKGDFVDIIADSSIHKGMPFKVYHGKTGRVFDVNQHAVGIIVNKQVRGYVLPKKIHVRIEHIRKSQCYEAFKKRVKDNDTKRREAHKAKQAISLKRQPA